MNDIGSWCGVLLYGWFREYYCTSTLRQPFCSIRRPVTIPFYQIAPSWNVLRKCTKHLPDPGPVNHQNVLDFTTLRANNTVAHRKNVSTFSCFPDSCPVGLRENPVVRPVKQTWWMASRNYRIMVRVGRGIPTGYMRHFLHATIPRKGIQNLVVYFVPRSLRFKNVVYVHAHCATTHYAGIRYTWVQYYNL
jgi:hypothetical protein